MGLQFHETQYGKKFFDRQLPALIDAANRLADIQEKICVVTEEKIATTKKNNENITISKKVLSPKEAEQFAKEFLHLVKKNKMLMEDFGQEIYEALVNDNFDQCLVTLCGHDKEWITSNLLNVKNEKSKMEESYEL